MGSLLRRATGAQQQVSGAMFRLGIWPDSDLSQSWAWVTCAQVLSLGQDGSPLPRASGAESVFCDGRMSQVAAFTKL